MFNIVDVWNSYSRSERRNIALYIGGIMFYKLGLEFFNGSITALAADRFSGEDRFGKLGGANGLNQAAQCVGAILIAPLVKIWPTRTVLGFAILFFGLTTSILLIVDASTGGRLRHGSEHENQYGRWNENVIFPVWGLSGIGYGMIELIRRVIPCDIVGGDVGKLRRLDATVHIFYEIAGILGAFTSSEAIKEFGNNYSSLFTPIFSTIAGVIWFFVSTRDPDGSDSDSDSVSQRSVPLNAVEEKQRNYFVQTWQGLVAFFRSAWIGATLVLTHRKFIWLLPAYSLALYLHRFLESILAPTFAVTVLKENHLSQVIVGGSNIGELLGALAVFVLSDYVPTPMPWLRLDALALNLVWTLTRLKSAAEAARPEVLVDGKSWGAESWAWKAAGCLIPVSFGWAAGDVSLAAYIQSEISTHAYVDRYPGISTLGAIMAFLYSSYIAIYAGLSAGLGKFIDDPNASSAMNQTVSARSTLWARQTIEASSNDTTVLKDYVIPDDRFNNVGGIQFSICCVIILLATFIPKGSFKFNPQVIGNGHSAIESYHTADDEESGPKKPPQTRPGQIVL